MLPQRASTNIYQCAQVERQSKDDRVFPFLLCYHQIMMTDIELQVTLGLYDPVSTQPKLLMLIQLGHIKAAYKEYIKNCLGKKEVARYWWPKVYQFALQHVRKHPNSTHMPHLAKSYKSTTRRHCITKL